MSDDLHRRTSRRMKNKHAAALGKKGGKAGRGAAKARTPEQARAAAQARWAKNKHTSPMILEPQENSVSRAQSPMEGDTFESGDERATVRSVSDGVVRYQYFGRNGVRDLEKPIKEWKRLARQYIEGGADFLPCPTP